jgi:hypothetical protein
MADLARRIKKLEEATGGRYTVDEWFDFLMMFAVMARADDPAHRPTDDEVREDAEWFAENGWDFSDFLSWLWELHKEQEAQEQVP